MTPFWKPTIEEQLYALKKEINSQDPLSSVRRQLDYALLTVKEAKDLERLFGRTMRYTWGPQGPLWPAWSAPDVNGNVEFGKFMGMELRAPKGWQDAP